MNWFTTFLSLFTPSTPGSKSVVESVTDYFPSDVKKQELENATTQVQDASQNSARNAPQAPTHDDWFNRIVDGLNRLPRLAMAFWAIGELFGILPPPTYLNAIHPLVLNIIWTVIGFYFGIRTISQDIPTLINTIRGK